MVLMQSSWQSKRDVHAHTHTFKIKNHLPDTHTCNFACNSARRTFPCLHPLPMNCSIFVEDFYIRLSETSWPFGVKRATTEARLYIWEFLFNGFLFVFIVYATDKSSLSSLDCLSSIVDRITNSEQPGLPLQRPASLSPVASTDSQPTTPGASSSRLIYHVLWTKNLVSNSSARRAYRKKGAHRVQKQVNSYIKISFRLSICTYYLATL